MDGARNFPLGVSPFHFADLYDPAGLARLFAAFEDLFRRTDADGARALQAWRAQGKLEGAAQQSDVLLRAARVLASLLASLFDVAAPEAEAAKVIAAHNQVFAFKQQFLDKRVRRRKGPVGAPLDAHTHARLEAAFRPTDWPARWSAAERQESAAAAVALGLLGLWAVVDRRPQASAAELEAARQQLVAILGEEVAAPELHARVHALLTGLENSHRLRLAATPAQGRWVTDRVPHPIDPGHQAHLTLARARPDWPEALDGPEVLRRRRRGFDLTDQRMSARAALAEVDYCLLCHPRGKDSCRTGLWDKPAAQAAAPAAPPTVKQTPLGAPLTGCPLDERISEAHTLLKEGNRLAALAMIMRDNPMCPGTGHRICNDCMKSCVFQKQTPVNVPEVETFVVGEVLAMPYGFEIFALLTRFNPLRIDRPYALPYHGHNALVVGLGPAGYTLAHYLLCEGFGVVGIDGLKLEPLPKALTGEQAWPPLAVRDVATLMEPLGERVAAGFGGVAEYGITVRWDKNFLKVIHLNLARWQNFAAFGGIRLGSTLNVEDAGKLGFHHVALAAGAGRPTVVALENNLMRGMRAASDFLMGLQLGGAFRPDSLANLQVELPAVIIGGGLTAVDTATELAAYYPVQVRKLHARVQLLGERAVRAGLDPEEQEILGRMLAHARELLAEEARVGPAAVDLPALVRRWGGVTVAYRRGLTDSPAYRLNHEEVQKALEEGITFLEHVVPFAAVPDGYNHVSGLKVRRKDGREDVLPARSVIMAAGTTPNTIYAREMPRSLVLDARGKFFQAHEAVTTQVPNADGAAAVALRPVNHAPAATPPRRADGAFFTSFLAPPAATVAAPAAAHLLPPLMVSFFGDNHPAYAGNVVRAMASAKQGHVAIARLFAPAVQRVLTADKHAQQVTLEAHLMPSDKPSLAGWRALRARCAAAWQAHVVRVERLTPTIVEVVVRAPAQARAFLPGQFFRLQTFERDALPLAGSSLQMEGLALTGAWVDKDAGLLAMVALEMGVSSRLCAHLKPGQEVVVMGPTGTATEIPRHETVLLAGGGLGNAVLFSVAEALKARGNRVLYFAAYRRAMDLYKQAEVERHSCQVVWCIEDGSLPGAPRPQDCVFAGNVVQALAAYAEGTLRPTKAPTIALSAVDRIICIGSDRMMAAVAHARRHQLAPYLKPGHIAIASINSPMQCMMKEICAQCLQRHVDPDTGAESFVFSCFNQDQRQDVMDWQNLAGRLRQNTLMEKVSGQYLDALLARGAADAVAPRADAPQQGLQSDSSCEVAG